MIPLAFAAPALGAFKSIPRFVWYALAAALVFAFAIGWFNSKIEAAEKRGAERAYKDVKAEAERVTAAAIELKRKADATAAKINAHIGADREKDDAVTRDLADRLRLQPPPRRDRAHPPGSDGAGVSATGAGDDARSRPVDAGMAEIPWLPLVGHAERCDLNAAALRAWQRWWVEQNAAWERWKAEAERD